MFSEQYPDIGGNLLGLRLRVDRDLIDQTHQMWAIACLIADRLTDGRYIRILGRTSDLINVGGQKVYPAEVENVLLEMDNVEEATVWGRPNPVTGQIVAAAV